MIWNYNNFFSSLCFVVFLVINIFQLFHKNVTSSLDGKENSFITGGLMKILQERKAVVVPTTRRKKFWFTAKSPKTSFFLFFVFHFPEFSSNFLYFLHFPFFLSFFRKIFECYDCFVQKKKYSEIFKYFLWSLIWNDGFINQIS